MPLEERNKSIERKKGMKKQNRTFVTGKPGFLSNKNMENVELGLFWPEFASKEKLPEKTPSLLGFFILSAQFGLILRLLLFENNSVLFDNNRNQEILEN